MKKLGEEHKVAVRNIRRDANETLKKMKKDKELSEDDMFRLQEGEHRRPPMSSSTVSKTPFLGKEKEVMAV